MPPEQPPHEAIGVFMAVGVFIAIAILALLFLALFVKDYYEARKQTARRNERYAIRSRIVFSNQKNSEQPVVIINTNAIRLFEFFDSIPERNKWKKWVKKCYEEQNGSFPVYINGVLKG